MSEFSENLHRILEAQKAAQLKDGIPTEAVRVDRINRLIKLIQENDQEIVDALAADFGTRSEGFSLIELWSTVLGLKFNAQHIGEWMKNETREPLAPDARAIVEYVPKGVVGVMGPWNVPLYLIIMPLAGVIAAGNRSIIKPSEFLPKSSALLQTLIARYFAEDEIAVVLGGPTEGAEFSAAPFDHIMFTGSTGVGKQIMKAASDNLTPVTLELGGKCPTIVTDSFDLAEAAMRTMAVKGMNAGQICVAPDHVYVPEAKKQAFIDACIAAAKQLFPEGIESPDYTSMVNARHYGRMSSLEKDAAERGATVVRAVGSEGSRDDRRYPLTLVIDPPSDAQIMQDEIFGPLLPVIGYSDIDEVLADISTRGYPLSIFIFSRDDEQIRHILDHSRSGGITVNDVMANIYPDDLPFGGIGPSGMGRYHGRDGFHTFSNQRSIYYQSEVREAYALVQSPYPEPVREYLLAEL